MIEQEKNKLRVKVAELLGVKCHRCNGTGEYLRYGAHEWFRLRNYENKGEQASVKCDHITYDKEWGHYPTLPDYPSDLNACADFEKHLDKCEQDRFAAYLGDLTGGRQIDFGTCQINTTTKILWATAEQYCLAFIAVKEGK